METDEPDERDGREGLFGPEPEPGPPGPRPEHEPEPQPPSGSEPEANRDVSGQDASTPVGPEPPQPQRRPRHRLLKGLLLGAFVFSALLAVMAGWNKLVSTPAFCSTCHTMNAATTSAMSSVHSKVPCLACHERPGLSGALAYVPTLARESLAQLTGLDFVTSGSLKANACATCHSNLAAQGHPSNDPNCLSCHGNVAHPEAVMHTALTKVTYPHPLGYVQTHGQQVVAAPNSCNSCHQTSFCLACHFKTVYPHPANWTQQHGLVEEQKGISACNLCHPESFCVGCHGTAIPHAADWLSLHWQALQGQSAQPCYTCHPTSDCTNCHAEHAVHNQQSIYTKPPAVAVSPSG